MIDLRSFNYCFPAKTKGSGCPAIATITGEHYLEQEFELTRRSPAYASMMKSGRLGDGIWFWDLEDRDNCYANPGFWQALGFDPDHMPHTYEAWTDLVFDEDLDQCDLALTRHLAEPDVPFDQVVRCRTADGGTVRVRCRGVALYEDGVAKRLSGTRHILSDTREDELTEKMSDLMELSNDAISVWSPTNGVRRWSRGAQRMFGYSADFMSGRDLHAVLGQKLPGDWPEIVHAVVNGETWSGVIEWTARDGRTVYTSTHLQRVAVTNEDTLILQVDHNITAEVELRRHQRILTRELNHRVKNLFAVIRSLIKLSSMGRDDVPTLVRELDQRIAALAAAHVVSLGHEMENGAPLHEVLEAVLAPYPAVRDALSLSGPHLWLPQSKVTPMGLVLNELATNALKYGAWATIRGHVNVEWCVVGGEGGPLVRLVWSERSPDYKPRPAEGQRRRGFGSELIEMSTAQMGALMTLEEGPNGIVRSLTFEMSAPDAATARQAASTWSFPL